jgi:hypothetical protein
MSNIVFKGNVVKDFGEYLPAPYVERITVTSGSGDKPALGVEYSLLFLVEDDFNEEDIQSITDQVSLYYFFSGRTSSVDREKPLHKQDIVNGAGNYIPLEAPVFEISSDELYDSDDRRVIKLTSNFSFETDLGQIVNPPVYLYMFSSAMPIEDIADNSSVTSAALSEIAYEKVFSENLEVFKEEVEAFFDSEGGKYAQVPLLGLNRIYYKTETVTREMIVSKVQSLVNRFKGGSAPGLSSVISSIERTLNVEREGQNLLVQLDKNRKGFPNKTNNNPVGNLYAAFSRLLININSAFPQGERVIKKRYLTGKVFDLRVQNTGSFFRGSQELGAEDLYIMDPLSTRLGVYDVEPERVDGLNTFFINYQKMVYDSAKLFRYFDRDKFFEICASELLSAYRAALFSTFRIKKLTINIGTKVSGIGKVTIEQGPDSDNPYIVGDGGEPGSDTSLLIDTNSVQILNYTFRDSNNLMFAVQVPHTDQYQDRESVTMTYDILLRTTDRTNEVLEYFIQRFDESYENFITYQEQATADCSYNNITNDFNNFFIDSVKSFWDSEGYQYPWQFAPMHFAILSYVMTDRFSSFDAAREYAREVMYNISPETGNLRQLRGFRIVLGNFNEELQPLRELNFVDETVITNRSLEKEVYTIGFEQETERIRGETAQASETLGESVEDVTSSATGGAPSGGIDLRIVALPATDQGGRADDDASILSFNSAFGDPSGDETVQGEPSRGDAELVDNGGSGIEAIGIG